MESLAWKFVVGLTASETKLTRVNDQAKDLRANYCSAGGSER